MSAAAIMGLSGERLTKDERAFFADLDPWGFIVFKRNCADPDQMRALTAELRDCVGRNAPVFIDQEGGRVQRMRPPHWRAAPPAADFGRLYAMDAERGLAACRLNHLMLAAELRSVGVDADCAPCLDIPVDGADPVIGDRAFATSADPVIALGAAAIEGLEAGGCAAVIKHIPGHGRANVDSHHKLPALSEPLEALRSTDFAPFRALAGRAKMAMTAHIVLESVDSRAPATISPEVMETIVRGEIGFDGLVMTDDIEMKAMAGPMGTRVRGALDAGCDLILHCSGKMASMTEAAAALRPLEGRAAQRADAALPPEPAETVDMAEAAQELARLMAPLEVVA